jgi:predicted esterase
VAERVFHVTTTVHGRVLVLGAAAGASSALMVGFHGYGQTADDMIGELRQVPGADRFTLASVQALHPFYSRGNERLGASWMTRQDRELAIADNIAYVDRVVDELVAEAFVGPDVSPASGPPPIVFAGFSQGTAMAYRAALLGTHPSAGVIALGGDIPPDVKTVPARQWPPLLIGAGRDDFWYTAAKVAADEAFLTSHRVAFETKRFAGGHEWTDEFRQAAGHWLAVACA